MRSCRGRKHEGNENDPKERRPGEAATRNEKDSGKVRSLQRNHEGIRYRKPLPCRTHRPGLQTRLSLLQRLRRHPQKTAQVVHGRPRKKVSPPKKTDRLRLCRLRLLFFLQFRGLLMSPCMAAFLAIQFFLGCALPAQFAPACSITFRRW